MFSSSFLVLHEMLHDFMVFSRLLKGFTVSGPPPTSLFSLGCGKRLWSPQLCNLFIECKVSKKCSQDSSLRYPQKLKSFIWFFSYQRGGCRLQSWGEEFWSWHAETCWNTRKESTANPTNPKRGDETRIIARCLRSWFFWCQEAEACWHTGEECLANFWWYVFWDLNQNKTYLSKSKRDHAPCICIPPIFWEYIILCL